MSTLIKRLIIAGIGILAGAAVWPLMELLVAEQGAFPSYRFFTVVSGGVFGAVFGLFFASAEGVIAGSWRRTARGALTGLGIGALGGVLGFLLGQLILFLLVNVSFAAQGRLDTVGIPLARALGWAILGVFVGAAEGVRARSVRKILIGAIGGLLGGFLGGAAIEYAVVVLPTLPALRLAGLVLFGLLVSVFYGIIERQLSYGLLRLLNGRYKGKEFVINQRRMRIGNAPDCDILLAQYRNVAPHHVRARVVRGDVYLSAEDDTSLIVNDEAVDEHKLKYEDVIKIGNAKLFYNHE